MKSTDPFFSIIIPTYNREKLISATLCSIKGQTFTDYEVIVVDDGSTDNTEAVVRQINNLPLHYFRKVNGERGAARNFGINKAKGRFITFLDSDDVLYPSHLEEAYKFLGSHQSVSCYAQAYEIKDAKTNKVLVPPANVATQTINKKITEGNFLSCFGVFIERSVFETAGFEEERRFAGTEDWLLWLQLAARYPFYYNPVVTGAMLEHDSRSVLSFNEKSLIYRSEFLKETLEHDSAFIKAFGRRTITAIYAHMLTYTSLHLAISKKTYPALKSLTKAAIIKPSSLFTRRSLAIMRKMLF